MSETTKVDNSTLDNPAATQSTSSKRKISTYARGHEIRTLHLKSPPWSYIHLSIVPASPTSDVQLDEVDVRIHLTSALEQFLGDHGRAVSVDLLKVEGKECWLRIPRQDRSLFLAAVGGWVGGTGNVKSGWVVRQTSNWLSSLVGTEGEVRLWHE
ncbi:hypothetical protein BJ875DRAFT_463437 [Amylocarpus encephaloides]|uniref:Ribonucleases P/MRP subunit Pop8-like domain-containing protein n=1 Tax=Amylocarpus encephaloides TaxID=45428 RepID=A0A9P7YIA6_9HELO|nr:hypothetical protein BJ875DRAFT_463437 [Amylocarpus encephaloides]